MFAHYFYLHLPTRLSHFPRRRLGRRTRALDLASLEPEKILADLAALGAQASDLPHAVVAKHPHHRALAVGQFRAKAKVVARLAEEDFAQEHAGGVPDVHAVAARAPHVARRVGVDAVWQADLAVRERAAGRQLCVVDDRVRVDCRRAGRVRVEVGRAGVGYVERGQVWREFLWFGCQ